jgi:uncharacterized membrane protein YgcG
MSATPKCTCDDRHVSTPCPAHPYRTWRRDEPEDHAHTAPSSSTSYTPYDHGSSSWSSWSDPGGHSGGFSGGGGDTAGGGAGSNW